MGFSRQEYWSGLPLPSPQSVLNVGNCFCLCSPLRLARINQLEAGRSPFAPQHVHPLNCTGCAQGSGRSWWPQGLPVLPHPATHRPPNPGQKFPIHSLMWGHVNLRFKVQMKRRRVDFSETHSYIHKTHGKGNIPTGSSLWPWSENWLSLHYWPPG